MDGADKPRLLRPHTAIPAATLALGLAYALELWLASGSSTFCVAAWSMDMHMYGFKWAGNAAGAGCVVLLFEAWTLDTRGKFLAGALGTFLLAVLTELVGATRRERAAAAAGGAAARAGHGACEGEGGATALFAGHVALGYLLMLVAMTYQAELLLAVVLGLALGHRLFGGARARLAPSPDPCCAAFDDDGAPAVAGRAGSGPPPRFAPADTEAGGGAASPLLG